MSPEIFAELEEILRYSGFGYSDDKVAEILKDVLRHVNIVRVHTRYDGTLCDRSDVHIRALVV